MSNTIAEEYGIVEYLKAEKLDTKADENIINDFIEKVEKEIDDNYIKHPAIKHYKDTYNFVPPFTLEALSHSVA